MKTLIFKTFFGLFVLFFLNARADSQVEFRLVQKFMIVVSVKVNDTEKLDFLLDTGTNSTVVTPEVARKLNLRPRDRIEMITVAGKQIVPRSFLQSVALGSNSAKDIEVLIADLPAIRAIDKNICGVLGQNFLAQFNYLLDYERRRIVFDENGELESRLRGKQVLIENEENRLLITVSVKQNSWRLVLDSAASNLILFGDAGVEKSETSLVKISTNAGDGAAKITQINSLRIGDGTFYDLPAIIISDKNEYRTEDGLMPLNLFRSIYFNHTKGFVIFNPKLSK
jgi:predicted aspartyl protease